jgi:hypothetical protein
MIARRLILAAASTVALMSLTDAALAQMEGVMKYCKPDAERLCPGVEPGGGRLIGCLKAHKMEISVGCAKTLQGIKAKMGK